MSSQVVVSSHTQAQAVTSNPTLAHTDDIIFHWIGVSNLLGVPNHHFLTPGFLFAKQESENDGFKKGSESPLILKPPFKRNLFDSYIFTHIDISIKRLSWLLDGTIFSKGKWSQFACLGKYISYAFYMHSICVSYAFWRNACIFLRNACVSWKRI